jgi:hypothetical protein
VSIEVESWLASVGINLIVDPFSTFKNAGSNTIEPSAPLFSILTMYSPSALVAGLSSGFVSLVATSSASGASPTVASATGLMRSTISASAMLSGGKVFSPAETDNARISLTRKKTTAKVIRLPIKNFPVFCVLIILFSS